MVCPTIIASYSYGSYIGKTHCAPLSISYLLLLLCSDYKILHHYIVILEDDMVFKTKSSSG